MNSYLIIILIILIGEYVLGFVVEILNLKHASPELPKEFEGFYDAEKYKKSQAYLRESTKFSLVKGGFMTMLSMGFILIGGFNYVDLAVRGFHLNSVLTGLCFAGTVLILFEFISIPFTYYRTFVIEEKYGFNKTTLKIFIFDLLKSLVLSVLIGGIIFAVILWFFEMMGKWAWFYSWLAVVLFEIFIMFIAPVAILPLFNKYVPLENGELKKAIEDYAKSQNFFLKGIFKMDASKRSSKTNAFFTGFGKFRRIVLFDTLIEKHSVEELVSVLAHEVGHYKKRHVLKNVWISIVTSGLLFFVLSSFIGNRELFSAFGMQEVSIYASLIFFGFLYAPLNLIFSVGGNYLSRKHEYEADQFAVMTCGRPDSFVTALKKLSVDNLSDLTPHFLKVFFQYSHPPILERIMTIRSFDSRQ